MLGSCAHEMSDFPERLADDGAPVIGDGPSQAGSAGKSSGLPSVPPASGGAGSLTAAGKSSDAQGGDGQGGEAATGSGGHAGNPSGEEAGAGGVPEHAGGAAAGGTPSTGGAPASGGAAGAAGGSSSGGSGGKGGGAATAGAASGGSGNAGKCMGVPTWAAGAYSPGARVQNGVNLYECKPHPFSGWCGLEAYAPGSGWAWTDAWTLVGPC